MPRPRQCSAVESIPHQARSASDEFFGFSATAAATPTIASANAGPTLSPSEQLADDLVQADAAYAAGNDAALAVLLRRIEMRGAKPASSAEPDAVALWRARAPDTLPPMRGRALGPAFSRGVLSPGKMMATEQLFLSGKSVTVTVGVAEPEKVRLRVTNAASRRVCEQEPAHARDCKFTPVFTQRYRIELLNKGVADARYYLVVD